MAPAGGPVLAGAIVDMGRCVPVAGQFRHLFSTRIAMPLDEPAQVVAFPKSDGVLRNEPST